MCAETSRQEYLQWVANQSSKNFARDQSIKELFKYDDRISLWWFTSMAEKQKGYPLRWLFYMIHVVEKVEKEVGRVENWKLWMPSERMGRALHAKCPECAHVYLYNGRGEGLDVETTGVMGRASRAAATVYFLIRQSIEILLDKYRYEGGEHSKDEIFCNSEGLTILIQTYFPHSWNTLSSNENNEEIERIDRYFGEAPWELADYGCNVAWMPTINGREHHEEWKQIMRRHSIPDISGEMKLSWRIICEILHTVWKWTGLYLWHFEVTPSELEPTYRDSPLASYLRESIRKAVQGGVSTLRRIEEYRAASRRIDPEVVLYRNEFYTGGRCVSAAFDNTTMLVGIQHGLVGHEHTVYHFHSSEIDTSTSPSTDYISNCPAPDYFASFGNQTVDMFEEWEGYPAERVWPVGSLRDDPFVGQSRGGIGAEEKKNIRSQLHLPTQTPVALLCTGAKDQVRPWSSMLFEAIQMLDRECFLAVKLHPYNGGEPQVKSAAADTKFGDYRVYSEKIYSLLAVSDVVIASESTVLLEAGLFETPSIALKPPSSYQNYDFGELANAVSTVQELKEGLERALDGELKPKGVSDHLRNADGKKATKHLLNYISKVDGKKV